MSQFASSGPTSGDLCIRGTSGYIGIKDDTAANVPVGFAILNYSYLTDDQSLTIVLGDQGAYSSTRTYMYTHSNSSHTAGAYCAVGLGQLQMGSYTRSGGTYTYTPFTGGTIGLPDISLHQMWGSRFEFRNVGTDWSVVFNGIETGSFTVSASSVTFDSSHRSAAISMERKHSSTAVGTYPAGDFESFRIAGLTMNDFVSPAFVGSGAKMQATAATDLDASVGTHLWPTFFDTVEKNTDDVTVDVSNTKFTALIPAWYKVVLRNQMAVPNDAGVQEHFTHVLYVNGAAYEHGNTATSSYNGSQSFWPKGLQSTWTVYLTEGDYVQAGYNATGSISQVISSSGSVLQNVFSIALLTRNLM